VDGLAAVLALGLLDAVAVRGVGEVGERGPADLVARGVADPLAEVDDRRGKLAELPVEGVGGLGEVGQDLLVVPEARGQPFVEPVDLRLERPDLVAELLERAIELVMGVVDGRLLVGFAFDLDDSIADVLDEFAELPLDPLQLRVIDVAAASAVLGRVAGEEGAQQLGLRDAPFLGDRAEPLEDGVWDVRIDPLVFVRRVRHSLGPNPHGRLKRLAPASGFVGSPSAGRQRIFLTSEMSKPAS
jgi:hypothetical protein